MRPHMIAAQSKRPRLEALALLAVVTAVVWSCGDRSPAGDPSGKGGASGGTAIGGRGGNAGGGANGGASGDASGRGGGAGGGANGGASGGAVGGTGGAASGGTGGSASGGRGGAGTSGGAGGTRDCGSQGRACCGVDGGPGTCDPGLFCPGGSFLGGTCTACGRKGDLCCPSDGGLRQGCNPGFTCVDLFGDDLHAAPTAPPLRSSAGRISAASTIQSPARSASSDAHPQGTAPAPKTVICRDESR